MQIFLLKRINESEAQLEEQESRHCIKVLRHKAGDHIHAIDGKGVKYLCEIREANPKEVGLVILSEVSGWGEHTTKIHLAISPLRLKDRFEWAMEKAVELGVNEIHPIICARTDVYKAKFKANRIANILLSATKQCKRSHIPLLHENKPFTSFLENTQTGLQLMGYCEATSPLMDFETKIKSSEVLSLIIGPEGDFTEAECQLAKSKGVELISLGENRLRTETAAIYTLGSIKYIKAY
ncbi:MAG: RsmE family RNA methyltransferase [Bacteroidota bacterium]